MKPIKRTFKVKRTKKPNDLLKCVLQKSVYEKLPTGGKFRNSVLTSSNNDKMSSHFMTVANSMAVRLDSYCRKYTSIHGKSNSRLVDGIERIKDLITAEGFEWNSADNLEFWIRSLRPKGATCSSVSDQNRDSKQRKVTSGGMDSINDLESWLVNLKATMTSFIDHTWKYKAKKEIIIKEIIVNLLEIGVHDDDLASNSGNGTGCNIDEFEDESVKD